MLVAAEGLANEALNLSRRFAPRRLTPGRYAAPDSCYLH
jgi:hypothetical protein